VLFNVDSMDHNSFMWGPIWHLVLTSILHRSVVLKECATSSPGLPRNFECYIIAGKRKV